MTVLSIDIETYSSTDLTKSGVYRYVEDEDFQILLFAYKFGDDETKIVDLTEEVLPEEILKALTDGNITKTAFNANFERVCIGKHFNIYTDPVQWECTMVKSGVLGLPMSLSAVAAVLGLGQQKDTSGKALIRYFSLPCKPTKANGERTRNLPQHDTEKWQSFKDYCLQDVAVEVAIRERLDFFKFTNFDKHLWALDQKIIERGVLADRKLVEGVLEIEELHSSKLFKEAQKLTGLYNPNSPAQLKKWLSKSTGEKVSSLTKADVSELAETVQDLKTMKVLGLRAEMSKTSVKKYTAMQNCICGDGRIRGLLQYYGANRTGRWAGRLVQVQNLPRNYMEDLDTARLLARNADYESLDLSFDSVSGTLSQLVRTAFVAPEGKYLGVADFSAIEARVIAWLAGERWRLDVFSTHGKIYEASAAQMFRVPIESIDKGSDLRQKGKVAELALGYQGGPGALLAMGALDMGLKEEELPKLVKMWRNANQKIVRLWYDVQTAAVEALSGRPAKLQQGLVFRRLNGDLTVQLPSGRLLFYHKAHLAADDYGNPSVRYWGMNQTTKTWQRTDTYGGKLVENIVQAIARDCLAEALVRVDAAGFDIVMHVHDEIVAEIDSEKDLDRMIQIMCEPLIWAKGLDLKADGFITEYYKKD